MASPPLISEEDWRCIYTKCAFYLQRKPSPIINMSLHIEYYVSGDSKKEAKSDIESKPCMTLTMTNPLAES